MISASQLAAAAAAASPSESNSDNSTVVGSTSQCGVCEKDAETTKCAHCNKFACASCKKSHVNQMKFDIGRVVNQLRRGVPKLSTTIAGVEQKSEQARPFFLLPLSVGCLQFRCLFEAGSSFHTNFQQVKQHVETVKGEVRDTIERYIKELKDRQTLLNSELDTFQQGELRNLR